MKAWELDEIRRAVKGKWLMRDTRTGAGGAAADQPPGRFNGRICTDSRQAAQGELFFAIAGKRFDAHDFVKDVAEKGVAGIIVQKEPAAEVLARAQEKSVAVILVDDTVLALNRLAGAYRAGEYSGGMRAKVIAVGGSNGKTTTKRIIGALLAEKSGGGGGGHASPKSFNNNIGMPLTILEVSPSHEYVVLEIGTNAPGEIAALGEVCRPDIAVITSVGLEHLERLGDLEGVAREEASIAPFVAEGGTLVLPADAPELLKAVKLTKAQRILVGRGGDDGATRRRADAARKPGGKKDARNTKRETGGPAGTEAPTADLVLTGVRETVEGTFFSINGRAEFQVPLIGEHNAMNALMAVAVARRLGVSDEQIAAGLMKVKPAEGRFELLSAGTGGAGGAGGAVGAAGDFRIVHDAYNANPSSMEAALRTFSRLPKTSRAAGAEPATGAVRRGRKVVILGDMLELGVSSEAMHRTVGALVAALGFDLFVAIGPGMRHAAEAAIAGGAGKKPKVVMFADTAAALRELAGNLKKGDFVLLKGSRGMALENLLPAFEEGKDPARYPPGHSGGTFMKWPKMIWIGAATVRERSAADAGADVAP